jgi:formylmethanofuran dehydrogenase subunit B
MRPTRSPMACAETTIAVALRPREIDALLVAAHMAMDSLPADDEAALERAADRLLEALRNHAGQDDTAA